jgi:hypothetical protein
VANDTTPPAAHDTKTLDARSYVRNPHARKAHSRTRDIFRAYEPPERPRYDAPMARQDDKHKRIAA